MSMADIRRLNVAIVTETYPPEVNGVAMTIGRLAEGLVARGHRACIVRPRQPDEPEAPPEDQTLVPGLPIPRYPQLRFGLPAPQHLRSTWLQQLPDVIHIATEGPLGLSALAVARQLAIPVLSTFHTNFHSYSRHYGIGWLQGRIESYLRWFHNRTAATLVPTSALAEELTARGFRNVGVLSRGVDTALFNPRHRSTALRESWGAGPDDLVVLIVGRLAPEKNLGLALEAFAALQRQRPAARMVVVGDGPLREPLSRRQPGCRFTGVKQGEELAAHYASADLFLFPSLTETFGNVVCEALASGLPVVAFDSAAAGSLVMSGRNGMCVPSGDSQAFVAAASRLASLHPAEPVRRAEYAHSVSHLDWQHIYDSYAAQLAATIAFHERRSIDNDLIRCVPD
jgi:glycosyltransferase involved in cell wall biosynthesis